MQPQVIYMNSIYLQLLLLSAFCLLLQLSQVDATLSTTPKGPYRDNLLSLKSDIKELIFLTKESLQSLEDVENTNEDDNPDDKTEDLLDREYIFLKVYFEIIVNSYQKTIYIYIYIGCFITFIFLIS